MEVHRRLSFFFSSRRRHTIWNCDWSSDVCSSDLPVGANTQTGFGGSGFGQSAQGQAQGQAGVQQSGTPTTANNAGQTVPGAPGSNAVSADDAATASPSGLVSDAPVIGGNIIGVGSKVNKRSIIVYDKATNYRLFEFIWNPSKDLANALNQQTNAPT